MDVVRSICAYKRTDEGLEFEIELKHFPIVKVRDVLKVIDDDQLYYIYPLTTELESVLRATNQLPDFDRDEHDFFLECSLVSS